jgi:hypothetical protein
MKLQLNTVTIQCSHQGWLSNFATRNYYRKLREISQKAYEVSNVASRRITKFRDHLPPPFPQLKAYSCSYARKKKVRDVASYLQKLICTTPLQTFPFSFDKVRNAGTNAQ